MWFKPHTASSAGDVTEWVFIQNPGLIVYKGHNSSTLMIPITQFVASVYTHYVTISTYSTVYICLFTFPGYFTHTACVQWMNGLWNILCFCLFLPVCLSHDSRVHYTCTHHCQANAGESWRLVGGLSSTDKHQEGGWGGGLVPSSPWSIRYEAKHAQFHRKDSHCCLFVLSCLCFLNSCCVCICIFAYVCSKSCRWISSRELPCPVSKELIRYHLLLGVSADEKVWHTLFACLLYFECVCVCVCVCVHFV